MRGTSIIASRSRFPSSDLASRGHLLPFAREKAQRALIIFALFLFLDGGEVSAASASVNSLAALGPALTACWHAPDGSEGQQVTVLLSLDRSGAVIGRPRITYSKLIGSLEAQRSFMRAVLASLTACTPVPVTPALGNAIAGRPFAIRFIGGLPGIET